MGSRKPARCQGRRPRLAGPRRVSVAYSAPTIPMRHHARKLAIAYQAAGRTADAILLYQTTLKQLESKLGPDDDRILAMRNNLASAFKEAGRTDEAISLLESMLEQNESNLTPDYRGLLAIRTNLANAFLAAGRTRRPWPSMRRR